MIGTFILSIRHVSFGTCMGFTVILDDRILLSLFPVCFELCNVAVSDALLELLIPEYLVSELVAAVVLARIARRRRLCWRRCTRWTEC